MISHKNYLVYFNTYCDRNQIQIHLFVQLKKFGVLAFKQKMVRNSMQTSQKKKIHFLLYVVPRYVSNSAVGEKK